MDLFRTTIGFTTVADPGNIAKTILSVDPQQSSKVTHHHPLASPTRTTGPAVFTNIQLQAPNCGPDHPLCAPPSNIICMIDVSGSMHALVSTSSGEQTAFTSLDLAKHSLTVLIHTLRSCDSLCIISFSSDAKIVCTEPSVDDAARQRLITSVKGLVADGNTNIWGALTLAIKEASRSESHSTLLLLTDGQPNVKEPPGGSPAAYAAAYNAMPSKKITLHTLGYGYDVASDTLSKLASCNAGLYAFIPDASFVGTVFINLISTIMATAYHHVWVTVFSDSSSPICESDCNYESHSEQDMMIKEIPSSISSSPMIFHKDIGALQFGHNRNFSLLAPYGWRGKILFTGLGPETGKKAELANVQVCVPSGEEGLNMEAMKDKGSLEQCPKVELEDAWKDAMKALAHQYLIHAVEEASDTVKHITLERRRNAVKKAAMNIEKIKDTLSSVKSCCLREMGGDRISAIHAHADCLTVNIIAENLYSPAVGSEPPGSATGVEDGLCSQLDAAEMIAKLGELPAMLSDLEGIGSNVGQLKHAVECDEWFQKWGRHYLPSVLSAHRREMCLNFKDASLQFFQGPLFKQLQSQCETLFCTLPPPIPSGSDCLDRLGGSHASGVSMSTFYNYQGGCFHGSDLVRVKCDSEGEPKLKEVRDIQRGDRVLTGNGQYCAVDCVIVTPVPENSATYYDVSCAAVQLPIEPRKGVALAFLTAYHPVWIKDRWAFPIDVGKEVQLPTEAHYNLLLEEGATDVMVQGVRCITLGHGITNSTVAAHNYLGTQLVREDIAAMKGYPSGKIVLDGKKTARDPENNLILHWVEAE